MSDHDLLSSDQLDALINELPSLEPPPGLDASILEQVARTPQDPPAESPAGSPSQSPLALPSMEGTPEPGSSPANRPGRWWIVAGPLVALAAAVLVAFTVIPGQTGVGNPDDFTPRGDVGAGPGLDLSMAVQTAMGTDRFQRGQAYEPGDTLLFRIDAYGEGHVTLVRVDREGAQVLHTQQVQAGTADLTTGGGRVGYAMEEGEESAVFAAIRTDVPLTAADVADGLSVEPTVEAVCAAAWELGGRCSAQRVEAVR